MNESTYRQSYLGKNALGRLRASMQRLPLDEPVDAVVIGTGAGGAPLLAKLAAAGLKVVALEAGPWFESPAEEFATEEGSANPIYWLGERISGGETPIALGGNTSGTGVGGSTLHWGAFTPRADERDLKLRTDFGEGVDWPLTYAELLPYYEEVERFLGVSGPQTYPWDPSRRYPTGPVAVNGPGQLMLRAFRQMGLRATEAPLAALSTDYTQPEYGERKACVNRGFCHQGCRNGAKGSMDVTYLPWAVRAGAEIRPQSFATGFERDGNGLITAVIYRDSSGPAPVERRQKTAHVFLCAGAVETPRLLLHAGLANNNGQVGRHFTAHVATQVWGTFDQPVRMNKGFPATVISEDTLRPRDADFAGGYLVQSLGVVPVTFANTVARGRGLFGAALMRYLADYNYVAGIGVNGECLSSDANRLELSDEVDPSSGLPKPRILFSYGRNEKAMDRHATRLMTDAWSAVGARDIWAAPRVAHTIGTCRMGVDPAASVVDPFGRSHEIGNLWISDNSTFPSSLAANPALTIMALALRTAEAFLKHG